MANFGCKIKILKSFSDKFCGEKKYNLILCLTSLLTSKIQCEIRLFFFLFLFFFNSLLKWIISGSRNFTVLYYLTLTYLGGIYQSKKTQFTLNSRGIYQSIAVHLPPPHTHRGFFLFCFFPLLFLCSLKERPSQFSNVKDHKSEPHHSRGFTSNTEGLYYVFVSPELSSGRDLAGFEFNHFFGIAVCAMQIHVLCSSHQILYSSFFAMQNLFCIAIARFWIAVAFCACVIVL